MKEYQIIQLLMDGCANCISMKANLLELGELYPNLEVMIWEGRQHLDFIEQYKIEALPCVVLMRKECLLGQVNGFQPLEILKIWIEAKMES
ncbi:MAG: hypothetical protein RR440_05825 [Erysipelotrichaceae bacterium]